MFCLALYLAFDIAEETLTVGQIRIQPTFSVCIQGLQMGTAVSVRQSLQCVHLVCAFKVITFCFDLQYQDPVFLSAS